MHEFSITNNLVGTIITEAKKRNAKKVLEVKLMVGEFTFLGLDQILFAYQILIKNTILAESKLLIECQKGIIECDDCKYKGKVQYIEDDVYHFSIPQFKCPECGGTVKITKGKECLIKNIKVVI